MRQTNRSRAAVPAAAVLLAALAAVSLCVGSFPLSLARIGEILAGGARDTMDARVFWTLRVPRVCMGLLAGLALGLAGGVYQTVFRNPLASPDLTGVAAGASFGAACAIVLGAGGAAQIMGGAFAMGLLSLALVLLLVRAARIERTGTYILAGIIVSSAAEAGLMVLKTMADPERELAAIEFWTMGSLASVTADKARLTALCVLAPLLLLLLFRRQTAMLSLGEEAARGMGLDPAFWRTLLLVLTTLMVAAVVSVTGVIAFAGLIAPHIAFLLARRRGGPYLALCALVGADILLAADMLARSLSKGAELPLSILTILFAVPVLALLLCRGKGGRYGDDA
ncbi:MAG: iron ABC transporter permease [Eubacteriales bacterium]|nr:iron ABC transporter permease [Eubacteriales bacterium]